jgi:putative hydrolase of the HAD superfamily
VDGTLYLNASMYLHSLPLALSHLRLIRTLEAVRGELRRAPDATDDFHRVQARLVATHLGITPERAYALVEARVYTRWYRIFSKLRLFPDAASTIASFQAAGLKIAFLSDFPIRQRLTDLGLPGPWDAAFSSEETHYLKPHPRPFEVLAERLGLPPGDILYVGNSYRYDVLGGTSAGMPVAHLTRRPRPDSQAVLSFSRYESLKEFVFQSLASSGYDAKTGRVPV